MSMSKIKLLTFYSDTHEKIYKDYFLSSFNKYLSESFNLLPLKVNQLSKSGDYGSDGFEETMISKIKHVLDSIDLSDDNPLVFADCDIQFFGDFKSDVIDELSDFDIKFQNDVSCRCAGFFICKQNEKVLNFFEKVYTTLLGAYEKNILNSGPFSDQVLINEYLNRNLFPNLKHGVLSNKYFTVVMSTGTKRWDGDVFNVPTNILVHHANWTVGIVNKIKLLDYVKNKRMSQ